MRTTAILSTLVLSVGLVAGCGGESSSSSSSSGGGGYCDDLKAAKADFESFESSTPEFDQLDDAIDTFHDLAEVAPAEVEAEWKTLDDAFTTLEKDLDSAGLALKDLGKLSKGQVPDGFSEEDLEELGPTLETTFGKLDDPKFKEASEKIEKHAKSECDVDLDD